MQPYRLKVLRGLGRTRAARKVEEIWSQDYLHILETMFPSGKVENGDFRVNGEGERGRRVSFKIDEGIWSDWAEAEGDGQGRGVISFVAHLEGWAGIAKLLRTHSTTKATSLDIPLYLDGKTPDFAAVKRVIDTKKMVLVKRWEYRDVDNFLLGVRVRLGSTDPARQDEKEFRLLSYRSKTVREDGKVRPEGWRVDGGWGESSPLYGGEMFGDESDPRPVLISEGEKATDAARMLVGDVYRCVTWGDGGAKGVRKGDWRIIPKEVDKVFWPDKDPPGKKAAEKLAEDIKGLRVVDVWDQPDLADKDDLADVPSDKSPWVKALLLNAKIGSLSYTSKAHRDRYIYVIETEQFLDTLTMQRLSPSSLSRAMAHEVEKLADELLADAEMTKVDTFTFWPGRDYLIDETSSAGGLIKRVNLWRPNDLIPDVGEPELFLDHMKYLIPEEAERDYLLSYLAYLVQKPGEKIHHAPVIGGEQGIGKSYLLVLLTTILGTHNVTEITTESLASSFNSWMEESQVVIVEEILAVGRREITNKLKPLITSPTTEINNKGVRAYRTANRVNFMFFTNHRDALALDEGDRRFFVYWSNAEALDEEYYEELFRDLEENAGRILHYLQNYDISRFRPKGRAPSTSAKTDMIKMSQPELVSEILSRITEELSPFDVDVVTLRDVCDWARDKRIGRPAEWSPEKMVNTLMRAGCVFIGRSRVHGSQNRLYSVRSHELYMGASEDTLKSAVRKSLT